MKISSSSKPISSPGRLDKFPPPLMRFLRSNVGRKSRGRSRASPMFFRKKTTRTTTAAIETQEPTSPKVTCIGQVRVRRSRKPGSKPTRPEKTPGKCCFCLGKPQFCCSIKFNLCPGSIRPVWLKWVRFFSCRSVKVQNGATRDKRIESEEDKEEEEEDEKETFNGATTTTTTTTTPPKNALLLTRCRSAPYRSASLAVRFWGEETGEEEAQKTEQQKSSRTTTTTTASETAPFGRDSASESRVDRESERNLEIRGELICRSKSQIEEELMNKLNMMEGEEGSGGNYPRNLMLKRCKSEPARRGSEKFDPQTSMFWRHRRLGNTESCTPHAALH